MSMPTYETTEEESGVDQSQVSAIHVVIDNEHDPFGESQKETTPEFGSWQTISFGAAVAQNVGAQPILRENRKRRRAIIIVQAPIVSSTTPTPVTFVNPPVPASATAQANYFGQDALVTVIGGTVSAIAVNGNVTGLTSGPVVVPEGGSITLTYTVAPTWTWAAARAPVTTSAPATVGSVFVGARGQILNGGGAQLFPGRYVYEAAQEVWITSDGVNPMIAAVLDERYLS